MGRLTEAMLKQIMPHAPKAARKAAPKILEAVAYQYDINNAPRMRSWLSALAIESGELKYQEELASGVAYEGRKDLGNTQRGDGRRFKGRGRIQLTGRDVYTKYTEYIRESGHLPFIDFVKYPHRLAEEPYATDSAGWFVNGYKNLNPLADRGDILAYHIKVNGRRKKVRNGKVVYEPNHWTERQEYYRRGVMAIPSDWELEQPEPQMLTDEDKEVLENQEGWPDFDVIPMEDKDIPETPLGEDEGSVSSPESLPIGKPAPDHKNGSEGLQTSGNAMPVTSSEPSKDETPQTIGKERPSLFSRVLSAIVVAIGTAIASITTTCGGNEVANLIAKQGAERIVENAERSDLYTFGLVMLYILAGSALALGLFWIGAKIYERSAERSNRLNKQIIEIAADKDKNTVVMVEKSDVKNSAPAPENMV